MKIVKGNGGGIAFRIDSQNEDLYYYFVIGQDGSYSVYDPNAYYNIPLVQGSSSAIYKGLNQTNLIAAVVRGTIIVLYVNHKRVATVGSSAYTHGQIGVIVPASSSGQTEVIFQNAKVWDL